VRDGIPQSVEVAGLRFPGREDYLAHYNVNMSETTGLLDIGAKTVVAIQRDWHSRGQNGCVFAMRAAYELDEQRWSASVHHVLPDATEMRSLIKAAVANPINEIHSFLFPNITQPDQVRELMRLAVEAGCVMREHAETEGVEVFRLRWMLGDGKVESWMVGFAAMQDVPPTRRAPFTELVIRTKLREREIHPDLNADPTAAHVANIDLGYDPDKTGRLIKSSKLRAARLLGGPVARANTPGARAKTTFGLTLRHVVEGKEP